MTLRIGKRYVHPRDGLIEIKSGVYTVDGRVSNHWVWVVVDTGEKKDGYGENWPLAPDYRQQSLSERDLDLIEVALEAAAESCQSGATLRHMASKKSLDPLAREYLHALDGIREYRRTRS